MSRRQSSPQPSPPSQPQQWEDFSFSPEDEALLDTVWAEIRAEDAAKAARADARRERRRQQQRERRARQRAQQRQHETAQE